MAKEDYTQLAEAVIQAVGGKDNIISVQNCMTRLRFVLKDDSVPDAEKVKAIKGVKGVMNQGGQYQIIIGTHVNEVIKDVRKAAGITEGGEVPADTGKKDSLWNRFFKTISGSIMPMLGPMIAGGIIKGILTILTTAGILADTDGTYLVLYAAADSVMYFMPIIVGFTCGKLFGCSPYITAVIGAAFLYPDLLTAVSAEGGITFLTIPVSAATYSNTFLPVLLASFVASKLEKLAKKFIPKIVQLMLVPAFVLAVTVPLSWLVIGPVMNFVSSLLSTAVTGIFGFSPLIGGLLVGAFWQLMVVLGLHYAFIPILMNNFFTQGSDPINAVMGLTVWALAGVALGYALKMKSPEQKSMGFGNFASAMCGVTEPTIYSIALPNLKLFACAWIGGGVTGAVFGALGGKMYAFAGDGLFRIPGMINPEGLDISFYGFIICAVAALIISTVLSFIVTNPKEGEAGDSKDTAAVGGRLTESADKQNEKTLTVYAPVKGRVIDQKSIPDETFASGALGQGVSIEPEEEIVTAPCDGVISVVAETKHSVGISSDDGMELLIHVGVDTVKMNGDGFKVFVKEGEHVKAGQKLIHFDIEKIRKAGFDPVTAVLVLNADDIGTENVTLGYCERMDEVIRFDRK